MVSQLFGGFLEVFNIWIWILFWIIIILTLALGKGKRFYWLAVIVGFLLIFKFIDNFFVSIILIFCWELFTGVKFFPSTMALIIFIAIAAFLGLSNPFFYLIIYVLYAIMVWHFISMTFGSLDSTQPETK